jgi:hypothetical protein
LLTLASGGGIAKLWHHYQTRVNAKELREAEREKIEVAADAAREQIEIEAAKARDKMLVDSIQWTRAQYETLLARITAAEDRARLAEDSARIADVRARASDERSRALQMENGDCHKKYEEVTAQCVSLRAQNEIQAKEIADLTQRLAALERK